jgi:hypothetical protein
MLCKNVITEGDQKIQIVEMREAYLWFGKEI